MPIIDAHQHFWWHGRRTHVWPEAVGTQLDRDFTPADLRQELDTAGIDGSVLIQSLNDLDETREYLQIAKENAFVRGVVGWVPLDEPAGAAAALAVFDGTRLVGVRHLIRLEAASTYLAQPKVLESLRMLAAQRLTFESVPINAEQFAHLLDIAERLPDLRLIIDHLGRPPVPEGGWELWAAMITRAARLPNVSIKLSTGIDLIMRWKWSADELRRYTDHVIGSFGARRVMAASNWPVLLISASYQHAWSGIVSLLSGCSEAERAEILGGTAARVYRL